METKPFEKESSISCFEYIIATVLVWKMVHYRTPKFGTL